MKTKNDLREMLHISKSKEKELPGGAKISITMELAKVTPSELLMAAAEVHVMSKEMADEIYLPTSQPSKD